METRKTLCQTPRRSIEDDIVYPTHNIMFGFDAVGIGQNSLNNPTGGCLTLLGMVEDLLRYKSNLDASGEKDVHLNLVMA